jgi:hypothetical protein
MPEVTQYRVLIYGSPDGFLNRRAEIRVYEGENLLGNIRFHDPGRPFPNDGQSTTGSIIMRLPSTMFSNVLDLLRNEKPIDYSFKSGHAVLGTSESEPVGEAE